MKSLPWKSAWITGAGRGIGKALAIEMAKQGVHVYASSRTISQLNELKAECANFAGEIIQVQLDISSREEIHALMMGWEIRSDYPDIVILNAGTHDPFSIEEFSAERCEKLFTTNLQGTLNCLSPMLKRYIAHNHGHIAVVSSVAGYRGLPTAAAYGASKAALINLCESLRSELNGSRVKLQIINPGFVRTPLTDKNHFKMPALLEPEDAALRILTGLQSNRFEISFPRRFVIFLKILRVLPYSCYFSIINKIIKF